MVRAGDNDKDKLMPNSYGLARVSSNLQPRRNTGDPSAGAMDVPKIDETPSRPHRAAMFQFSQVRKPIVDAPCAREVGQIYCLSKRLIDLVVGLVLLIVAMPIILIADFAIRVESKGSPFFVQTRLGKNGGP